MLRVVLTVCVTWYAIDPIIWHLLEVSVGLMRNLQVITQELTVLSGALMAAVPIPNPTRKAQRLIPKITSANDVKAFLATFKRTTVHKHWLPRNWAHLLALLLTGEAQQFYPSLRMATAMAEDYNML